MPIPTEELKAKAIELGFDALGITAATPLSDIGFYKEWLLAGFSADMGYLSEHLSLKADPQSLLAHARSVICVRATYSPIPMPGIKVARYAVGKDYHKVLRRKLKKLVAYLEEGYPESRHRICVDSAPLLERGYAHRAGLGWFGKNTCLIDSKSGSWFFIACVLSTLDLSFDRASEGQCGTCTACIDSCPTQAIVPLNDRWAIDSRRCISYLTIERRGEPKPDEPSHDGWIFGCDVCQEVCPFNTPRPHQPRRAQPPKMAEFLPRSELKGANSLVALDLEAWNRLSEGTALRRTGIDGFNRNLKIVRQSSGE